MGDHMILVRCGCGKEHLLNDNTVEKICDCGNRIKQPIWMWTSSILLWLTTTYGKKYECIDISDIITRGYDYLLSQENIHLSNIQFKKILAAGYTVSVLRTKDKIDLAFVFEGEDGIWFYPELDTIKSVRFPHDVCELIEIAKSKGAKFPNTLLGIIKASYSSEVKGNSKP